MHRQTTVGLTVGRFAGRVDIVYSVEIIAIAEVMGKYGGVEKAMTR